MPAPTRVDWLLVLFTLGVVFLFGLVLHYTWWRYTRQGRTEVEQNSTISIEISVDDLERLLQTWDDLEQRLTKLEEKE